MARRKRDPERLANLRATKAERQKRKEAREKRNATILADLASGMSKAAAARRAGVSYGVVVKLVAKAPVPAGSPVSPSRIEKGIPIPAELFFPLDDMQPGDSLFVPETDAAKAREAVSAKAGFVLGKVEGGVRIWRING